MRPCTIEGCHRELVARGWCGTHYMRWKVHGDPTVRVHREIVTEDGLIRCNRCDVFKPPSGFHKNKNTVNGLKAWCAHCSNALTRRSKGVSVEVSEIIVPEGAPCEVCGRDDVRLHLDHDHSTGAFRGFLCGPCNRALGMFRDDSGLLAAAISYLEKT